MNAPLPVTRAVMIERDGHRCVACPSTSNLEAQHRAAVGMGGSRIRPTLEELVTACTFCNEAFEHRLQAAALRFGWKVQAWVRDRGLTADVPVFYTVERTWFQLYRDGRRQRLTQAEAIQMMRAVYGDAYNDEKGLVG